MKKQNSLIGFLLIGFGIYFFLRQLNIPELSPFYTWPSLLIITGGALLLHSYIANEYTNLFAGALLLGFGIHFHAIHYFGFWSDHWGIYVLIIGIAFLLRYQKFKIGLIPALILIGIGAFALLTPVTPGWFSWLQDAVLFVKRFWPFVLIGLGFYMVYKK
ncbi:DUF5668 domain-containing protein [Halobacillus litoralis]|uniref:LiaI-LiaF-like domain-containing protein n=1 Tax=Halobacillus litoralis TaxID=45668 RepID=UPI001CD7ED3F|nr:DUF5668 domain-containing protein [Halobacillus litoralis]MCA0969907.1 DUF5668 domain-containing protein [Halobacillus litoralis]